MYELAICEIYNSNYHGISNNINIDSQYLIYNTISLEEFYNNEYLYYLNLLRRIYDLILLLDNNYSQHCNIRKYKTIISNINYSKLDIVEIFILPTNEWYIRRDKLLQTIKYYIDNHPNKEITKESGQCGSCIMQYRYQYDV